MALELSTEEKGILKSALEHYLGNLREEVYKTEKHTFKKPLKKEEDVIKSIIQRLN